MKLTEQVWQIWFILSIMMLAMVFFVGTLNDSKIEYPNWIYYISIAFINLLICLRFGLKTYDNDEES